MKIEAIKSDWYIIALFFAIGLPVTFSGYNYGDGLTIPIWDTIVYLFFTLSLAYIIVYILFPIFFPKKQIIKLFFWTLLLMIIFGIVEMISYRLVDGRPLNELMHYEAIFWAISSSAENAGILIGILLGKKFYDAQLDIQKKEKQMRDSELRRLKSQVDPHFLFNNLNTVDALIDSDPKVAKSYLKHLSMLYRYLIRTKDDEVVPLDDELEFAQNYIYLIEKRFGSAYQFAIDEMSSSQHYFIPPGTLQTVLENVVKHNSGSAVDPIHTHIELGDDSIVVTNNKHQKQKAKPTTSTGIKNLSARYKLLSDKLVLISDDEKYTISLPILNAVE